MSLYAICPIVSNFKESLPSVLVETKMEEIEYKLKQKNAVLIANTIAKLVETIRLKSESDPGNVLKFPELKYLRQKCEDSEHLVSINASQGVVALVEMGVISLPSTLSGFISTLVTARNYTGIIYSIGQLLMMDLESRLTEDHKYTCPFSVRNPEHPLVTVLKQRKDVWMDVFNQLKLMFSHPNKVISNNSEELMRPLILYTFCVPSSVSTGCRLEMWDLLLKTKQPNIILLLDILSMLQADTKSEMNYIALLHLRISEFALTKKDATLCAALSPSLTSLTKKLVCNGHDPAACLTNIVQLLQVANESSSCVVMLLSEIVTVSPSIYLKDILRSCKTIVEMKSCNLLCIKMLEFSLLQWLVYPSYLTGEAVQLGSEILTSINEMKVWSSNTGKLLSNSYFDMLRAVDMPIDIAVHLCRLGESWQSNSSNVKEWLNRVSEIPGQFFEKLHFVLSALLIHPFEDNEIQKKVLKLILLLVEKHNELSGSLLTILLYKLSNETEPKLLLELLRSLTQMGVLKENIALILHTLETMKARQVLRSVVLELYLRLWKIEHRCYPYLEKLLQETSKDPEIAWEFDIAKAAVIKEICQTRPDLYSAELVAMLSKILTHCTDVPGSLASSLALEGLAALCQAGIVDVTTTWKALAPKLNRDKRPVVMKSWCKFMGTVASLRCVTLDYEKLVSDVVQRLWNYITSCEDTEIIEAAFSSLSKFNLDQLTLKGLPEQYRYGLKLPSSYAKTPVDAARKPEDVLPYIPSECWVQMLLKLKTDVLDSAGNMLSRWSEVIGFHCVPGRAEPTSYSNLPPQCICRGLVQYLLKTYVPEENMVFRQCLRILNQNYAKPLPPLNWMFLEPFFKIPELQEYCIALAAKQCITSPSARKVLEEYITALTPCSDKENEILYLFSNLGDLCKGIPPNVLKPLIDQSLCLAIQKASNVDNESNLDGDKYLREILNFIKIALKIEDINEANRKLLSLIMESYLGNFDVDNPLFAAYVECVVELPTKYIERMSSPSVWWEVTPDKLRLAMGIRTAMTRRADTEMPLVWLNECIDATTNMSGEHTTMLKSITSVLTYVRGNETNCPWLLELMGRIQLVIDKSEANNQQAVVFLCDVFIITIIVLSGYDCLNISLEGIANSREIRLRLFPQSLANLLTYEKWNKISSQVIDWLIFMQKNEIVLPMYAKAFQQSVVSLRHDSNFRSSPLWYRFLDSK